MVRNSTPNRRLNGLYPLAYLGDNPTTPCDFYSLTRDPTTTDFQGFYLCDMWLNTVTRDCWILVNLAGAIATWIKFAGGAGDLLELTGNTGGPVFPLANNINVIGDAVGITITGVPGTHTLTASLVGGGGQAIQGLKPDVGAVVNPLAGVINIHNVDGNIVTSNGGTNNLDVDFANVIVINPNIVPAAVTQLTVNASYTGVSSIDPLINAVQSANSAVASRLGLFKNRAGAILQSGDAIGNILFNAYDGTQYLESASIRSQAVVATGIGNITANLQFLTNNGSAITGRMVISSAGNVTINAPDSGNALDLPNSSATVQAMISTAGLRFVSNRGTANTFVGSGSGNFTLTTGSATSNSSLGQLSLSSLTTGANNSALGWANLIVCTTGSSNSAFGSNVLTSLTTGSRNCALGNSALSNAGGGLLTGSDNIAIGSGAGTNYQGAESSNVLLSNAGVLAESNHIRIGTTGGGSNQQNKCWIAAIRGVTTDVNDAIPVLIDSTGQLGTVSSSARFKENIVDMLSHSDLIMKLRPVLFNYIEDKFKNTAVGLIAEEVAQVLPNLAVNDADGNPFTVKYLDLIPMLLNEVQKLNKRLETLENSNP